MQRRRFLHQVCGYSASAVSVGLFNGLRNSSAALPEATTAGTFPIAIFTKIFQSHTFDELAAAVRTIEADGVEATIRNGGHIEPARAAAQIPELVAALAKFDKKLLIAASDVNSVTPENTKLLQILRDNGVLYYRMGYYKYRTNVAPLIQARAFAAQARELADLNRELGVVGLYQNHAGKDYVGNLLWDLAIVMDGIDSEHLGIALDLRHLRAEISGSYQTAVEAIRPHLRSVYLKDAQQASESGNRLKEVPLGQGMVNHELFRSVWKSLKPAPLAVHVEYFGQKPLPVKDISPIVAAYKQDVATLRKWMG